MDCMFLSPQNSYELVEALPLSPIVMAPEGGDFGK